MAHEIADFSIIIPTFHEAQNIPELVRRIAAVDFGSRQFELLVMDDNSQDGIVEAVAALTPHYAWLRLVTRLRNPGLSQAVVEGMQLARYPLCIIMDADLSHPPEKIPEMLQALKDPQVDIVLGSRYVPGGSSDEHWPWLRRSLSQLGARLAQLIIGVTVQDPLSGFIAVRRNAIVSANTIKPIGWKVGLEIMVKCHYHAIVEIPIHFAARQQGNSKLNVVTLGHYLRHLLNLFWFKLSNKKL